MDWDARAREDVLEGILALLVSFAGLADRAAGMPLSLALPGLAFLAHGEAVARSYVAGLPTGAPALVMASDAADRAERLAADFRALARMLRALLARARRRALCAGKAGLSTAPREPGRTPGRLVPALPAPDTS